METIAITYKEMRGLLGRKRAAEASKGDFGRLLVVAGCRGMAGAAALCARGALRAGAGLVTFSVEDGLLPIVQAAVPEATCVGRDLAFDLSAERLSAYDAIAIGPGLGITAGTRALVDHILDNYGGKLVIDADALNVLAGSSVTFDADTVITPHPGEAARLLGADVSVIQKRREAAAAILSEKFGCVAVLKGAGTLVAVTSPALAIYQNTTGGPGMATGGAGDVLTGVIASFAAQGMAPLAAAKAGVYVHGMAGDLAAKSLGERGLTAGDLPLAVAGALKQLGE